jgi:hypothetical protein
MRFENVDGDSVYITREAVLSALPNDRSVDEHGRRNQVTLVWLRGHRRHVALRIGVDAFIDAMGNTKPMGSECATSALIPGAEL